MAGPALSVSPYAIGRLGTLLRSLVGIVNHFSTTAPTTGKIPVASAGGVYEPQDVVSVATTATLGTASTHAATDFALAAAPAAAVASPAGDSTYPAAKGPVLLDDTNGHTYRITTHNGAVLLVQVS